MKIYTYDNKIMTVGGKWMEQPAQPGPGPSLPPYTIRLKYKEGVTPSFSKGTAVQVSSSPNVWDLTYENTDWSGLIYSNSSLLEVIDGNTTGVVNMRRMLQGSISLTTVPLLDTSSVTDMNGMLAGCDSLILVPLFNTSNVTDMSGMLFNCSNVQSGALALYQQASSQTNVPSHDRTFYNCGANTTTGAAELAQIPYSWGGNS